MNLYLAFIFLSQDFANLPIQVSPATPSFTGGRGNAPGGPRN